MKELLQQEKECLEAIDQKIEQINVYENQYKPELVNRMTAELIEERLKLQRIQKQIVDVA
jgi:hypothetical protein